MTNPDNKFCKSYTIYRAVNFAISISGLWGALFSTICIAQSLDNLQSKTALLLRFSAQYIAPGESVIISAGRPVFSVKSPPAIFFDDIPARIIMRPGFDTSDIRTSVIVIVPAGTSQNPRVRVINHTGKLLASGLFCIDRKVEKDNIELSAKIYRQRVAYTQIAPSFTFKVGEPSDYYYELFDGKTLVERKPMALTPRNFEVFCTDSKRPVYRIADSTELSGRIALPEAADAKNIYTIKTYMNAKSISGWMPPPMIWPKPIFANIKFVNIHK